MTFNGWFQILSFSERSFAVTPLIGGYMARSLRASARGSTRSAPARTARLPDDRR